jgi:hypothetical protein
MLNLTYPSKGFVKRGIKAVNAKQDLTVNIPSNWRGKAISNLVFASLNNEGKMGFKGIFCFFLFNRFLTLHFYAASANCSIQVKTDGGYVVSYLFSQG